MVDRRGLSNLGNLPPWRSRKIFGQFICVDRTIVVDGVRVRYLDLGAGKPLLLLHGLGHSSTAWLRTAEAFAERRRVLAPDLPGFGKSETPAPSTIGPDFHTRIVLGFLKALGFEHVGAIGHSAGALVLLLAALEQPARFTRLVLVNPVGFTPAPSSLLGTIASSVLQIFLAMPRSRPIVRMMYEKTFFDPATVDEASIEELFARREDPVSRLATEASFAEYFEFCKNLEPLHERLKTLGIPVLVVWGSDDLTFPVRDADVAAQVLRDARIERFERCGHHPHIEMPNRFARVALEFLSAS
jgi:pimeloyl-ACP methyl ester carboxylesterase